MQSTFAHLDASLKKGLVSPKLAVLIQEFYESYKKALENSSDKGKSLPFFHQLIELVIKNLENPYTFEIFHQSIRQPFDYYQFGLDFIRPLIDFQRSKIDGNPHFTSIQEQLLKGENVILLANHQTEPDPQIMSLLIEKTNSQLAEEMIFVAGHRVISDPLAVPMSMGRNLLCIYSKKHIDHPPEEKAHKILHNQRTIKKMGELLNEGGHCIYVAPSGGRDRPNADGQFEVASFDAQSIELFWLIAQQAKRPTHFYPVALKTYSLMPPPTYVEKELGEKRITQVTPVYLSFGPEVNMEHFPGSEQLDKKAKRNARASYIWNIVKEEYEAFSI